MTPVVLASLALVAGLGATAVGLVFLAACAPNGSADQSAVLLALAIGLAGVGLASVAGFAGSLLVGRAWLAMVLAAMPVAGVAVVVVVLLIIGDSTTVGSSGSPVVRGIAMLIFGSLSAMLLYVGATQLVAQLRLVRSAEPVEATIVASEVVSSRSFDSDRRVLRDNSTVTYEPVVRFRFEVDGVEHEGTLLRPTVIVRTYPSADGAAAVAGAYPVGTRVTAWVDRTRPDLAFLVREPSVGPVVFLVLGLGVAPVVWSVVRLVL